MVREVKELYNMSSEVEIFAINASNSDYAILNRWVIYAVDNNHEVYLETTKNNKIAKVHAATFDSKSDAVEFIMSMDKLCTMGIAMPCPQEAQ